MLSRIFKLWPTVEDRQLVVEALEELAEKYDGLAEGFSLDPAMRTLYGKRADHARQLIGKLLPHC